MKKAAFHTDEAANYLGVHPATLAKWRCTGHVAIPFIRIGRAVRYRKEDLDAYLERHRFGGNGSELA